MSRRIIALIGVAAAAIVAVGVVLLPRGGDDKPAATRTQGDTRAEALSYAPRNAPALVGVDTGSAAASLVLGVVVPQVSGGALTANDVSPLLGNEAVVAILDQQRAQLSMVAKDPDALRALTRRLNSSGSYKGATLYRAGNGATIGVKGDTIVAGSDAPTVTQAIDTAADKAKHVTPPQFDRRLAGLPAGAGIRAVFDPKRIVVATRLPGVLNTRWGRSLTNGAAVLEEGGPGLRLPFVLQTDAARINDQDLPFGTGTTPPQMRGRGPLLIATKDFARLIAFLRKADPERLGGLDSLQSGLPGFLRINIDGLLGGLHGDGTVSSDDGLSHFAARTDPPDPGDWRTPLNRLSTLSSVLQRLGIDNIKLDEEPRRRLPPRDRRQAHGPGRDLRPHARDHRRRRHEPPRHGDGPRRRAAAGREGRPHAAPPGERGPPPARQPLRRRCRPPGGGRSRQRRILARLGELTGWARAATDGVRGQLDLGLR